MGQNNIANSGCKYKQKDDIHAQLHKYSKIKGP